MNGATLGTVVKTFDPFTDTLIDTPDAPIWTVSDPLAGTTW